MAMNPVAKAEAARKNRRRRRQLLGLLVAVVVVIGLGTIVHYVRQGVSTMMDDTAEKQRYTTKLQTLAMYDPLPFADVNAVDPVLIKQAAIWGAIYSTLESQGSLDVYDREAETDCVILPALDVDSFAAQLLGPDYKITHESFETDGLSYRYDEDLQGYLIPVTGQMGQYGITVEKMKREGKNLRVTVGYIPVYTGDTLSLTVENTPTKYMDYIFTRADNREFYLTALENSEMVPAATATPAPAAASSSVDLTTNPDEAILGNLDEQVQSDLGVESTSEAQPAA